MFVVCHSFQVICKSFFLLYDVYSNINKTLQKAFLGRLYVCLHDDPFLYSVFLECAYVLQSIGKTPHNSSFGASTLTMV